MHNVEQIPHIVHFFTARYENRRSLLLLYVVHSLESAIKTVAGNQKKNSIKAKEILRKCFETFESKATFGRLLKSLLNSHLKTLGQVYWTSCTVKRPPDWCDGRAWMCIRMICRYQTHLKDHALWSRNARLQPPWRKSYLRLFKSMPEIVSRRSPWEQPAKKLNMLSSFRPPSCEKEKNVCAG